MALLQLSNPNLAMPSDFPSILSQPSSPHMRLQSMVSRPAIRALVAAASTFSGGEIRFQCNPGSTGLRHGCRSHRRGWGLVRAAAKVLDYYATLNLSRNASLQDIKSAYRNLARRYHPDMNKSPGAEEKFKEISAAYEVLSDNEKRSLYDRFGEAGLQETFEGAGGGQAGVDPSEVFNAFFGDSNGLFGGEVHPEGFSFSARSNRSQGLDIRYDLTLSFEESIFGGQRELDVMCYKTCDNCNGSGAKSKYSIKPCSSCGGRGAVMNTQRTAFGVVSQVSGCSNCGGNGKVIVDPCRMCNGEGRLQAKRTVVVGIPAGVSDGFAAQVQGEGSSDSKRGVVGDLYIFIRVKEKPGFRRDGVNLYSDISIDYTEAILGTILKVETVDGYKELQVPAGTQPGETLKLVNMGVPNINRPSVRGDHHFIVRVQIPRDISDLERSLIERLASLRTSSEDCSIPLKGKRRDTPDKYNVGKRQNYVVQKEKKLSLWDSIKNLFGKNQKRTGFASITCATSLPAQVAHSSADPAVVILICGVLVAICFSSLTRRRDPPGLFSRRQSHPKVAS